MSHFDITVAVKGRDSRVASGAELGLTAGVSKFLGNWDILFSEVSSRRDGSLGRKYRFSGPAFRRNASCGGGGHIPTECDILLGTHFLPSGAFLRNAERFAFHGNFYTLSRKRVTTQ